MPDDDYASFVSGRAPDLPHEGLIVDEGGRVLGRHPGVHHFTIGQRKRLGLMTGAPMYVLALNAETQAVVVGPRQALERGTLTASGVNWMAGPPTEPMRVAAQIRHRHPPAAATVRADGADRAAVVFDEPQIAITPGQAVVFYQDDIVLGGGWID